MKLFLVLYVDGALIFNIREEAMKDSKNTFQQIKKLGLNMHVGKEGKFNRRLKIPFSHPGR